MANYVRRRICTHVTKQMHNKILFLFAQFVKTYNQLPLRVHRSLTMEKKKNHGTHFLLSDSIRIASYLLLFLYVFSVHCRIYHHTPHGITIYRYWGGVRSILRKRREIKKNKTHFHRTFDSRCAQLCKTPFSDSTCGTCRIYSSVVYMRVRECLSDDAYSSTLDFVFKFNEPTVFKH